MPCPLRLTLSYSTGATGYIGGDALYAIANAHSEFDITCLVRNSDKGAKVASQYPKVRLVYGDLDSTGLLEEEAKKADIVLREYNGQYRRLNEIKPILFHLVVIAVPLTNVACH